MSYSFKMTDIHCPEYEIHCPEHKISYPAHKIYTYSKCNVPNNTPVKHAENQNPDEPVTAAMPDLHLPPAAAATHQPKERSLSS